MESSFDILVKKSNRQPEPCSLTGIRIALDTFITPVPHCRPRFQKSVYDTLERTDSPSQVSKVLMSAQPPCSQCGAPMEVRESPGLEELICHQCGNYLSRPVDPIKPLMPDHEGSAGKDGGR